MAFIATSYTILEAVLFSMRLLLLFSYRFEENWFRARASVFFVDYGETEIGYKDCVCRNIIYQDVPVQTLSASLYNFSTLLNSTDMTDCGEKALDRICGLLIDKVCAILLQKPFAVASLVAM